MKSFLNSGLNIFSKTKRKTGSEISSAYDDAEVKQEPQLFPFAYSSDPAALGGEILDTEILKSNYFSPAIYNLAEPAKISSVYGPLYLSKFKKAIITSATDAVRVGNRIYWAKARHPLFNNLYLCDGSYASHDDDKAYFLKPLDPGASIKSGFSLLGPYESHWAHFLSQYLPRVRYLEILRELDREIKIVVPAGLDSQAKSLLRVALSRYGFQDSIIEINQNESVFCEDLYYADSQSWICDSTTGPGRTSIVVPDKVADYVKSLFDEVPSEISGNGPRRLYLRRDNHRNILNIEEVDAIMAKFGFTIIEPHLLTLERKKEIFSNADCIVGPFGSALTNIITCRPGTKVVAMSNLFRLDDAYIPVFAAAAGVDLTYLAGTDRVPNGPHSDYTVRAVELKALVKDICSH